MIIEHYLITYQKTVIKDWPIDDIKKEIEGQWFQVTNIQNIW